MVGLFFWPRSQCQALNWMLISSINTICSFQVDKKDSLCYICICFPTVVDLNSNTIVHVMTGIQRATAQLQGKYELRAHYESVRTFCVLEKICNKMYCTCFFLFSILKLILGHAVIAENVNILKFKEQKCSWGKKKNE